MRRYGELVGRRPRIIPVPWLSPRLSSYWLRLVTSVPTNVARALIDGLTQDVVARDDRLARLVPQRLQGFPEAAREALEADRQHAVATRWVEGFIACRSFQPRYGFYAKQVGDAAVTQACAADIRGVLCVFGKAGDFFYANGLWWPRRALDWLAGGPGLRRTRRHPAGIWELLYWFSLVPADAVLFRGDDPRHRAAGRWARFALIPVIGRFPGF